MTTYLVAVAATALLFVAFAAFHRQACDGSSCGTGAGCGACPNEKHVHALDSYDSNDPNGATHRGAPEDHDHA